MYIYDINKLILRWLSITFVFIYGFTISNAVSKYSDMFYRGNRVFNKVRYLIV